MGETWTDVPLPGMPEPPVTCPRCGRTSHNPDDAAEGYCGFCHDWTSEPRRG